MVPLRRNRDFLLLQTGQALSALGSQSSSIAYPLLALAVTHSPAQVGIVSFARLTPFATFVLLAGLAADRWNRKSLMVASDGVRVVALAFLVATVSTGHVRLWEIAVVAFVEGVGSSVFTTAQTGALRAVVPRSQLPAAAGAQEARRATVRLAGPSLGGVLFQIGRSLPFLVDAISYAFSTASLLLMRTPFQETRDVDRAPLRTQIAEGFRFLWSNAFLRTCAFLYGLGNFVAPGVLLALVVVGRRQGLTSGELGLLIALFGAATLAGSLASPLMRRLLSVRAILLCELWTWLALFAFVIEPSVYVLLGALSLFGFAAPVTDSVVNGYRVAMTPDRLLGRVESVRTNIALLIAPLGPLVAGVLLSSVSAVATIAVFGAFGLVLALWGTLSGSIRNAPSLDELR